MLSDITATHEQLRTSTFGLLLHRITPLVTCLKDFGFDTPDLSTECSFKSTMSLYGVEPNRIEI